MKSHEWINDKIVHAAQSILKKQCGLQGWQNTLLGQFHGFKPISVPFVQILHVLKSHWVTISNALFGCEDKTYFRDCIKIYDSLLSKHVTLEMQKNVFSIMQPKVKIVNVDVMNVMKQPNSYDCGVFAIAFATEIAHGYNPIWAQFDVGQMRNHLLDCLEKGCLSRFPVVKIRRIPLGSRVKHFIPVKVYCVCRNIDNKKQPMIECDLCKEWFHFSCLNISSSSEALKVDKWKCPCVQLF